MEKFWFKHLTIAVNGLAMFSAIINHKIWYEMEKTIFFNDFCANKGCEEYIAWNYDCEGYPVNCESCKLIGQSHDIIEYPENCLFLNDIQKFEREQKQALNIAFVSQQRELLRAYHNYLLQNTDKNECLHTIDEFLEARNSG